VVFKEASEKWEVYRTTYLPKLQGRVRSWKSAGIGPTTAKSTLDVKTRSDSALVVLDGDSPSALRREACSINRQYTFSLRKNDKGWVLDKLSLDPSQDVSPMSLPLGEILFGSAAKQFTVSKAALPELVKHPSFSIRSVTNLTTAEGLAVVRVEFGFKPHMRKKPTVYVPLESGNVTLVPSQFWRVLECEATEKYIDSTSIWKASFEVELKDGVPLLKSSYAKWRNSMNNGKTTEEEYFSECDLRFEEGVPEIDFYLTAFGLPEPVGITAPAPSRFWLWITLTAIAAIGLGILFHRLKRRYQAQAAEPVKT